MARTIITITVDGNDVSVTAPAGQQQAGRDALAQGGLYRSTTGRTWLYDPAGDSYEPWVRVLDKNGRPGGSLIGKRYADTQEDVSFPVRPLTEGAAITR